MKRAVVTGVLLAIVAVGCAGAGKPPLQPDSDGTSSLGDGGPEPAAASAQPAAPAPPK
jgi:hypothetical protein